MSSLYFLTVDGSLSDTAVSSADIYGGTMNRGMDPRGRGGNAASAAAGGAGGQQQGNNAAGPGGMGKKSNSTSQLSAAGKKNA